MGELLDFFVNGYTLQYGVVFFQLQTLGGVLAVLGGDVTGSAGHAAGFVFGALKYYLHAITFCFLCHDLKSNAFNVVFCNISLFGGLHQCGVEAEFVDGAQTLGGNVQGNPHFLFGPVELLGEEVHVEFTLGTTFRVRNVVTCHGSFARDLTHL